MKYRSLDAILRETFLSISALREAYMQVQPARPCDYVSEKATLAADKVILRELKKLSELRHRYRWQGDSARDGSSAETATCSGGWSPESEDGRLQQERGESTVGSLKLELQKKDAEIHNLNATVERLVSKKEKLERRVKKLERKASHGGLGRPGSWDHLVEDELATPAAAAGEPRAARILSSLPRSSRPQRSNVVTGVREGVCEPGELRKLLERAVAEVRETVVDFSKVMVAHMRRAKWDVDEPGVAWAQQSHKVLAVQSHVCLRMFSGFEHEDFYMSGRLSSLLEPAKHRGECLQQFWAMAQLVEEPLELLAGLTPDCSFGRFCKKKFLQVVTAAMEEALLGGLEHRRCIVEEDGHPGWSRFYEVFVRMARGVWMVHKLAFSMEPRVCVIQADKGADFCTAYMESEVPNLELASETQNLLPKVAFTVMPGFQMGAQVLLRCHVYLNGMKAASE